MKAKALRSSICDSRTHKKLHYLLFYFGSTYIMISLLPIPKTLKQPAMVARGTLAEKGRANQSKMRTAKEALRFMLVKYLKEAG